MDDFSWTNRYYEPEEENRYFWTCDCCFWESQESEINENDLPTYEECPECQCNVSIVRDWIQI